MTFLIPKNLALWPPENNNGNVEYKAYLINCDKKKISRLATQMRWRQSEGSILYKNRKAFYVLGIHDNGKIAGLSWQNLNKSIDVLEQAANLCDSIIYRMLLFDYSEGAIAILCVQGRNKDNGDFLFI